MILSLISLQITRICSWGIKKKKKPTDRRRKRSTIHVQSSLETETFLQVYKSAATQTVTMNQVGTELVGDMGGGRGMRIGGTSSSSPCAICLPHLCVF